MLLYADDMNGILRDVASAKEFLKVVERFGNVSGLKLNREKTEGMWLGRARQCNNKPLGMQWPKRPIRVLGVYVSYDEDECNKINFDERILKCNKVLNEWKSRNLTMLGRIAIVKTFVISQFLFVSAAILVPNYVMKIIDNMITSFIWRG